MPRLIDHPLFHPFSSKLPERHSMKRFLSTLALVPFLSLAALSSVHAHTADEEKADAERHRAMAAAHEAAAKCLEAGKGHEQCMKELQLACKGLAIGKFCGMKHQH